MEKSEEMVVLPLLMDRAYRACTIPYRFPSDNPKKPTPTELSWINLFAKSIPSFRKRAETDDTVPDAPARAEKFAQRYTEILEDLKKDIESHGGPPDCVLLCQLREQVLREVGFKDIFKKVKEEENAKAISIFQDVVHLNDAIEDDAKRMENLIKGIFAGNIFDLGSAQLAELFANDDMSFQASCQNLVPRPWVIDDLDEFVSKWVRKSWKKVVIFVDNSGADIILGILPFARELLRHGVQVVLAANELPSINDVTYPELIEILAKLKDENGKLVGVDTSNLFIANSGNDLPVIDLTRVSQELSYLSSDADLIILEGMMQGKQSLPISQSDQERPGIRRRLSSLSLNIKIQSYNPSAAAWAFRRSKSVSSLGEYAGNSIRKWWEWGWGWILSRKPTFARDLEMKEEETAHVGFHSKGSWRHVLYKVNSQLRRKLVRSDNVGLPQTFRYDSFSYSKNFNDH